MIKQEGSAPREKLPFVDFIIINTPVWLFIALALIAALVATGLSFPLALIPLVLAWWSLCGAVMLSLDFFKRKRYLYFRLRFPAPPGPQAAAAKSLMQTLCGLSVYLAALRYSRTTRT